MEKQDGLSYLAKTNPDEPALMIENADTIYDDEYAALGKYTKALHVKPENITLARDGTGGLHILPYNINGTKWHPGDTITFKQLAKARGEARKLAGRYLSSSAKGKCAKAQYKLFQSIGDGAVRGAISRGVNGAKGLVDDVFSIMDPNVSGWDKMKSGMKQMAKALIQTPIKIIVDLFTPPILGLLKAPFHALGGAAKFMTGAAKTAWGLMQDNKERNDPRNLAPVRTRFQ